MRLVNAREESSARLSIISIGRFSPWMRFVRTTSYDVGYSIPEIQTAQSLDTYVCLGEINNYRWCPRLSLTFPGWALAGWLLKNSWLSRSLIWRRWRRIDQRKSRARIDWRGLKMLRLRDGQLITMRHRGGVESSSVWPALRDPFQVFERLGRTIPNHQRP